MLQTVGPWLAGLLALLAAVLGYGYAQRKRGEAYADKDHQEVMAEQARRQAELADRIATIAPLHDSELEYLVRKHEARRRRPPPASPSGGGDG